jgi:hypothetical protein
LQQGFGYTSSNLTVWAGHRQLSDFIGQPAGPFTLPDSVTAQLLAFLSKIRLASAVTNARGVACLLKR